MMLHFAKPDVQCVHMHFINENLFIGSIKFSLELD